MDVIPNLAAKSKDSCIQLGEVAVALISLLEAVHNMKRLFIDVKPDNFMACKPSARKSSSIAQRLRMIDLGLVESFHDMASSSHRDNMYPNGQVIGTPNYVSINVLEGNTPSRRDDMEALGYVIVELILFSYKHFGMLNSSSTGGRKSTGLDSLLPWSSCKSDEEILREKKESLNGSLYSMIENDTNKTASMIMKEYFDDVRGLTYKEKPKYDRLKSFVQDLTINTTSTSSKTRRTKKNQMKKTVIKSKKTTRASRKAISSSDESIEILSSDESSSKTNEIESLKETLNVKSASSEGINLNYSTTKRKTRSSARAAAAAKEIEEIKLTKKRNKRLQIVIESDDDYDHPSPPKIIKTIKEKNDTAKMIRDNTSFSTQGKTLDGFYSPKNEIDVAESSIKESSEIEVVEEDFISVCDHPTYDLTNGGDNDSFQSCRSPETMDWEYMDEENQNPQKPNPAIANNRQRVKSTAAAVVKPRKSTKSLMIHFIEGPLLGESFHLDHTVNVGKNPPKSRSKTTVTFAVENDSQVSSSHVQLVLNKTKHGSLSVKVKDMKSSNGTFVNGKMLPKGGQTQAFIGAKIQIGDSVMKIQKV